MPGTAGDAAITSITFGVWTRIARIIIALLLVTPVSRRGDGENGSIREPP